MAEAGELNGQKFYVSLNVKNLLDALDLKKEVVEAVLCPPCYRWKVTHEIMEREDLVYFSECGLCEIIKNEPEDDEKEEGGEEKDTKGEEDEKRDVEPAAASAGAPTVSEMVR